MAFLVGQTRLATAIAAKDTLLLVVTRQAYEDLLRLRRTNVKLVDRLQD